MSLSQSIYSLLPGSMRARISPVIKQALRSLTVTTVYPGVLMDLDPNEWIQNQLRRNKTSEPHTVARIQSILKPGDTYVDVGCHVGYLTLVARRAIGPSGLVLAIDPQPYNCAKVLHNWVLNGFEN
jgi:ubiquinone/menaquinone biosynthesis C-methylase UbiE